MPLVATNIPIISKLRGLLVRRFLVRDLLVIYKAGVGAIWWVIYYTISIKYIKYYLGRGDFEAI